MEAYRRFRYRLVGVLVLAGLLGGTAAMVREPWYRQVAARLWTGRPQVERARFIDTVDTFYASRFPTGNLAIDFSALDGDRDWAFITEQWWRASYRLYPRRVYVAPPGAPVNGHAEMLATQRARGPDWPLTCPVDAVLVFTVEHGQPAMRIVHLRRKDGS